MKNHLLEDIKKLAGLTESQIDPMDLSDEQKDIVEKIVAALHDKKLSVTDTHSTIHGEIVVLSIGQQAYSTPRYGSGDIEALARITGIRWFEFDKDRIMIGL